MLSVLALVAGVSCADAPEAAHADGRRGGIFNMNLPEVPWSLFPPTTIQASASRIASQIYQGLVRFDPKDLSVRPCLAERWEVDPSGTRYTFHLREGVRFQDDPAFPDGVGPVVTADDVVRCLTAICRRGTGDQMFWLLQDKVEGADACFARPADDPDRTVSGLEALDDLTVRITLTRPTPDILQTLAHLGCSIYPAELPTVYAGDLVQHAIGTGPFVLRTARIGESIVLERNPHYWELGPDGGRLPYLDGVRVTFAPEKAQEAEQFAKGRLSMITGLAPEEVPLAAGAPPFQACSIPALDVQFFGLNARVPPFDDVRVRRAFAMAIDRRTLVDSVLKGDAVEAEHGLVPPGLAGYPYELVPGVPYDPDSARRLLAAAGHAGGAGFPRLQLQLNNDGHGYIKVATEVQSMLQRELHVDVSVSVLPAQQHYERINAGEALFWREGWIADHPDAENFLGLLYGRNAVNEQGQPSVLNTTRYADPVFDSLFASARVSVDEHGRLRALAMAERVAMADLPLIPLYHERSRMLLQPWVRDLHLNAIEYLDLGAVWFDRPPAQAAQ